MKIIATVLATIVLIVAMALVLVYSGTFNVAASEPDSAAVHWLMETIRERSIESRLDDIDVPPLEDPALIAEGAGHYDAMCAICHLTPGADNSETRAGLNPRPPNLAEHGEHDAAETFWVIKNGIKMTGMPAWGATHNDRSIWGLVAFVSKLPEMSADEYRRLTETVSGGHNDAGHRHDDPGFNADVPATESYSHEDVDVPAELGDDHAAVAAGEGSLPVHTVDSFFDALAAGRTDAAEKLLAPDVLIFEGGGVERSREEYAAHHMQSDAAFLGNAGHRVISRTEDAAGELAWVGTVARIMNTAGDTLVAVDSTETMVLRKRDGEWRIQHIHWSSRSVDSE